ncbi:vacuolar protein sorting-associated protein 13 [Suillus bovinus]|uniref:vacuolar protein sorting-associated protein 13 n=1 Tax=Suillus bovinus TaxID=48563 RepID=UPI001B880D80|nr:vacuolar protein sorting-associated protein 13 [Suillus bovinus]KAG2159854.1 vacuolar protein sorting-associated protein 13 [Suillus bovinus]
MWWLDPGKEVLNVLFNRILAPYVENLDMNQVNYGIGQGSQLTLRNLRLKKGALDKFRLPVDVLEGHLGTFTLSLHWMNLGNQPVEILIEDVYMLVVPSPQTNIDPEEETRRALAAKLERLENAELLHMRGQVGLPSEESPQSQGLWASLTAKIINNLQVTVKNIHIRYEDNMSVPGHPFAAGITLAGFTAVSVNEEWQPAFIESTAGAIHKLARLESLAVYFDTDSQSMAGLPLSAAKEKFIAMISQKDHQSSHQFILSPVSGEGRIVMNHKLDKNTPHFDVQLLFDQIGIAFDDNQYRDAISLADMYHVYLRQRQYRKFRPSDEEFKANRARALLRFAAQAILDGVHDRRRKWTWAYFAERRDDRNKYVELFEKKTVNILRESDTALLNALECKLSYEDIRFYRSIARSRLRKDMELKKRLEEDRATQQQQHSGGWLSWLWGSQADQPKDDLVFGGEMTEEQRRQLYDVLDYDEKSAIVDSFEAPRDALKARVVAELKKGSFALKVDPSGKATEVISTVFDSFRAEVIQRPDNFEAAVSLRGFSVFDGTTKNTLHRQIVRVKTPIAEDAEAIEHGEAEDPFFFVKFESNPLDERADTALTARMRHMEIIYHRGYVEAIFKFFRPPESQLESVEALLNVASQTLEGLRKETRAGLEYALQTHKTIDLQLDMNSPIIIIPEDVTTHQCSHLVIDAGHIAVESDLADKDALREIHAKRNQPYGEDDYKRLESLMYDKMLLKLQAAQFVLGNDLQACRDALTSEKSDTLHLLERININLLVQNSIVPSAVNLARFKISGKLPSLQVNISDAKYKSLMRIIDVAIPNFDEGGEQKPPQMHIDSASLVLPLSAGLFGPVDTEYNVDDHDEVDSESASTHRDDLFFEASDGSLEHPEIRQHIFELDFEVDTLRGAISKSSGDGNEKPLGEVIFQQFRLAFSLLKFNMNVDINLRSLAMNVVQAAGDSIQLMSSESTGSVIKDLMKISYKRVQKNSPEFATVYESIDQSVDVQLSTFIFHAAPEPVVSLYDFIMTTFVPQSPEQPANTTSSTIVISDEGELSPPASDTGTIRVSVRLDSVQVLLLNDLDSLATLSLSTADVQLLLRTNTMGITGRLGSLALSDDRSRELTQPQFKQILSIEGKNFAEFRYQTLDIAETSTLGFNSTFYLDVGSLKVHFLEQPLHDIYLFVTKLAKLKVLYDAARDAAVQRASEIERMQFNVSVKTPIIVFPSDPSRLQDVLVMRLGEISARNSHEAHASKITASLRGIQLMSDIYHDGASSMLKIVDDIDIIANVIQTSGIDRSQESELPDTQIAVKISDVKLYLTQTQYILLMKFAQSIPKVLVASPEGNVQALELASPPVSSSDSGGTTSDHLVNLEPELHIVDGIRAWTTVDLVASVKMVKLHLYDSLATHEENLEDHSIVRFALNGSSLRYKSISDGAAEAQVVLKSFTMSNTRPGGSKFREIIPAADHDRNQFMVLYTTSGSSSMVILTVDSPHVILAIEPVIALLEFFMSAFQQDAPVDIDNTSTTESQRESPQSRVDFRFDMHDVSVSVLENDEDANSQALRLYIDQILLSQQRILTLTVNRLGMSLIRMGADADTVRFLDDVDLTFSMDSQSSTREQMTSMELAAKPIVFRASYRDIMLITTIASKAVDLYGKSQDSSSVTSTTSTKSAQPYEGPSQASRSNATRSHRHTIGEARVLVSTEQLKASFDGFRLILIGDMHEQPMLHLKIKPFIIGARDWSADLRATATLATQISYWNLSNSHWEPLIDPWTFTLSVGRDQRSSEFKVSVSAQERLDLNVSTAFVELAVTSANMWGKEGQVLLQKARGSFAPYRIRNRTGSTLFVWSDDDASRDSKDAGAVKITNDQTVDWRFDDWKTMREASKLMRFSGAHVSISEQHNIGIQIVGKPWEALRGIPVDREGEYTFSLRPRMETYADRLLCAVSVEDNVKIVTLRSTYLVENQTFYPLELTLVDHTGHPVYSLEKIAPGKDYALPIEAVTQNRIRLQPDQGFGYRWCSSIRFEDLITKKSLTISCPHNDQQEAPFRFQAWAQSDSNEPGTRKPPKIKLKLRAPIELENLLPYNIQYRIYDKDANQNWKSYLRKGGVMPVHSVELSHLILLNAEVQDTIFKPSDFAIINTDRNSDFDVESRLSLRDQSNRKLDLRLNYVRYPESGGAFKVQIYCPYLVINKTGLPFAVKAARSHRAISPVEIAADTRLDVISKPVPFLLSHPNDNGQAFVFKIGESGWSKVFSLEAPSAETEMVIPSSRQKAEEFHIGLSWTEGLGKYKLIKVITFAPRFLIKNNLPDPICFREHGAPPRGRAILDPGERCPMQIMRASREKMLTIAYPGLNSQWSAPINIEDIGSVYLRVGLSDGGVHAVKADVVIDGSTIFVILSATEKWPFVIENDSDFSVSMSQCDPKRGDADVVKSSTPRYKLAPHSNMPYAWDQPAAREKKITLTINDASRNVDIMEIGVLVPFKFHDRKRTRAVSLDVRADGHQQILRITPYVAEHSLYKPKFHSSSSLSRSDTMTSSTEGFEAIMEVVSPTLSFNMEFAGIAISLVNRRMVEVVYTSIESLKFEYSNSPVAQSLNLSCGSLQIDNQLHDALYPVIIQPSPIAKEASGVAVLPTIQGSVIWLKDQEHGVLFVKYCSILLQALTIEGDEDLLFAIYDLTQIQGLSWEENTEDVLIQYPEEIPEPHLSAAGQVVYFEVLELQPIQLSLSFMRTERISSEEKLSIRNPLAVVVNALTMTLGNINDAPLELNALVIKDMRLTIPELQARITYHYRQDVLRQLYRILGSADFIGNPVGLFTNVSSGVSDIFYAPYNGVVMHGNKELGIGIAKGAASFVKKTVFGLSDSMTKFTSSVGKGLSAATFDSEYQAQRRMNQRRNRPRHAIYGVAAGGEAFASSVVSAMEGIVTKPIQGAETEGALGFFKGVGKGLVGVVTKPAVGVFDLASNLSEGIRNTTTVFDKPERDRVRLPRHVPSDGILPFSAREALGQYWMKDLDNGAYRKEAYVAHIDSPGSDNVILLTSTRVLSFWSKKLRLDWDLPLAMVQGVAVEDTGIRFTHKSGKEHDKFVFIPDKTSQAWFFGQIASVVKAFNNRRRMDS